MIQLTMLGIMVIAFDTEFLNISFFTDWGYRKGPKGTQDFGMGKDETPT